MESNEINLESQLIKQAQQGSQLAFHDLLNRYWNEVYRFLLSKLKDENEAEDICIKAFAKAFDSINTFDFQYNFKSWILTIARNLYIDHWRKDQNSPFSSDQNHEDLEIYDQSPSPEDRIIQQQNLLELKAFIKQLKPSYAEIIHLRYFLDLSYKEIAQQTGDSLSNVKVKLLRAKKLLLEIISESK
jgi:RNA polymerase sigma-70 factor (ECF subfamily)